MSRKRNRGYNALPLTLLFPLMPPEPITVGHSPAPREQSPPLQPVPSPIPFAGGCQAPRQPGLHFLFLPDNDKEAQTVIKIKDMDKELKLLTRTSHSIPGHFFPRMSQLEAACCDGGNGSRPIPPLLNCPVLPPLGG